ncbi:MAG: HAD domain-containing protein [Candidatus Omnitrophica bacterium]|nr:HAD domain-containing protein [Candidatus Omnitrophota bacterium]
MHNFIKLTELTNIIFLDFDGVLNHQEFYNKMNNNIPRDNFGFIFDEQNISNLGNIIKITEKQSNIPTKIVVSSTYKNGSTLDRKLFGLDYLKAMWKERNYPSEVIDITPTFDLKIYPHLGEIENKPSIPRGVEIKWWLERQNHYHNQFDAPGFQLMYKQCKVNNYVIIDDDSDMLLEQKDNFVQTFADYGGLDINAMNAALTILNK